MSIIKTDMAVAREIHKTNIRRARKLKLEELDVEFQKALETGASTTDIVAKKNALRDAPADSAIDSATDEAALKAQWNTSILGTSATGIILYFLPVGTSFFAISSTVNTLPVSGLISLSVGTTMQIPPLYPSMSL